MKALNLLIYCLFAAVTVTAQLPPFEWVKKLNGNSGKALTTDAAGNVYILRSTAGGFISKFNTAGILVWEKQLADNISANGIEVDAAENIYITGQFTLTTDFDPGPAVFNITTMGQQDIFILKLDAAGNFLWAKNQSGATGEVSFSIALNPTGTVVYTVGYFTGTVDFDPGGGIANVTATENTDTYISALTADGDFLWVKTIKGGTAYSIATNVLGHVVIAGSFTLTRDFNPGAGVFNLTSSGSSDIFILKLDGSGNFVTAKSVGGIGFQEGTDPSVTLDAAGNIYLTGYFDFTVDFDPGPGVFNFTALGSRDIFVLKLDVNGSFIWAKQIAGVLDEKGNDIKTDAAGNVYITGYFSATVDFDPGPGIFNLTSAGASSIDIYISKLDTDGNFVWAAGFGEVATDRGFGIAVDAMGNVFAAGLFLGQIDFDPGPGTAILITNVNQAFLLKLGQGGGPLPLSLLNFSATANNSGNLLQWQTSQEINTKEFEIEWSDNGQYFKKIGEEKAAGNSTTLLGYSFADKREPGSNNYYRLKMVDMDGRFIYSKIVQIDRLPISTVINSFPNPVIDIMDLKIEALKSETILFYLHGADGKLILSKSFNVVKGSNRIKLNLRSVPAGTYFISSANDRYKTIQIIKQ
ncbi:MAG: T9SS type A sorting domain-containing protein [Ferruginibacter sp.]